jgi:hypothetical protein
MRALTQDEFLEKAIKVHGEEKYDYFSSIYTNNRATIIVMCKKHGSFNIQADSFMRGSGCRDCSYEYRGINRRSSKEEILKKFDETHGNKYDYSLMEYINIDTKIKIICSKHGIFEQSPYNHIIGQGCPSCLHIGSTVSKLEIIWLDILNISEQYRQKQLIIDGKKFKVDGFDPDTNTVYEFNGDFWHGNPTMFDSDKMHPYAKITYGCLYLKTLEKENMLKSAGYKVVSIWESDFKKLINDDMKIGIK